MTRALERKAKLSYSAMDVKAEIERSKYGVPVQPITAEKCHKNMPSLFQLKPYKKI